MREMIGVPMLFVTLLACRADPSGVWAVLYPEAKGSPACSNTVSHNFLAGQIAEDDVAAEETGWSSSTDVTGAQHLAFWQILDGEGQMVLSDGERAWLGAQNDDKTWTFAWTTVETTTSTDSHEWGYVYEESVKETEEACITIAFDGEVFTGTVSADIATEGTWTESDAWTQEIAEVGTSGQMPSDNYLVYSDELGELRALSNLRDRADCPNGECELGIDAFCTSSYAVSGFQVSADEATTYLALDEVGQ